MYGLLIALITISSKSDYSLSPVYITDWICQRLFNLGLLRTRYRHTRPDLAVQLFRPLLRNSIDLTPMRPYHRHWLKHVAIDTSFAKVLNTTLVQPHFTADYSVKDIFKLEGSIRSLINLNNWTVTSNMKHRDVEFVTFERLHCIRIEAYYRKYVVRIGKNCICIYLLFKNM